MKRNPVCLLKKMCARDDRHVVGPTIINVQYSNHGSILHRFNIQRRLGHVSLKSRIICIQQRCRCAFWDPHPRDQRTRIIL